MQNYLKNRNIYQTAAKRFFRKLLKIITVIKKIILAREKDFEEDCTHNFFRSFFLYFSDKND